MEFSNFLVLLRIISLSLGFAQNSMVDGCILISIAIKQWRGKWFAKSLYLFSMRNFWFCFKCFFPITRENGNHTPFNHFLFNLLYIKMKKINEANNFIILLLYKNNIFILYILYPRKDNNQIYFSKMNCIYVRICIMIDIIINRCVAFPLVWHSFSFVKLALC